MTPVVLMPGFADHNRFLHWHFAPPGDECASHRLIYDARERQFEMHRLINSETYQPRGPVVSLEELLAILPDSEKAKASAASITRTFERW